MFTVSILSKRSKKAHIRLYDEKWTAGSQLVPVNCANLGIELSIMPLFP